MRVNLGNFPTWQGLPSPPCFSIHEWGKKNLPMDVIIQMCMPYMWQKPTMCGWWSSVLTHRLQFARGNSVHFAYNSQPNCLAKRCHTSKPEQRPEPLGIDRVTFPLYSSDYRWQWLPSSSMHTMVRSHLMTQLGRVYKNNEIHVKLGENQKDSFLH